MITDLKEATAKARFSLFESGDRPTWVAAPFGEFRRTFRPSQRSARAHSPNRYKLNLNLVNQAALCQKQLRKYLPLAKTQTATIYPRTHRKLTGPRSGCR